MQVPGAPMKELFGFQKIYLKPEQSMTLSFVAEPKVFTTVDKHVRVWACLMQYILMMFLIVLWIG